MPFVANAFLYIALTTNLRKWLNPRQISGGTGQLFIEGEEEFT